MKFATILFHVLTVLASAALAGPVYRSEALTSRNFIPGHIVWQSTANRTQSPMTPRFGSVKACQRTTYYSGTPASGIHRSDCQKLVDHIESDPGYWEMWWWDSTTDYKTLASNGTCNFAISRTDGESSGSNHSSDVAIIGNTDVVGILYHVLSYGSGEDINSNNIAGVMDCKWYFANNAMIEFVVRNNVAVQEAGGP
ncbi:hypothetical protein VP1G_07501 [Cytospora mali]|uniref:Ecp2 effector protein-like domain-containing protein n=1 Tax=Cytospora mali TaxID=578113 RepID=A0A194V8G8_CYTMA|nr:hypothetical protein VP1G_07501 [Valsa mali var. pyri (nom. inval.)]